jgi:hypothetical protein
MTAKIGWPWNSTLPSASNGSSWLPLELTSLTPGTSLPVKTQTTPGWPDRRQVDATSAACARSERPSAAMQQAGGFRHVVDIVGGAGDVLVRGIVAQNHASGLLTTGSAKVDLSMRLRGSEHT